MATQDSHPRRFVPTLTQVVMAPAPGVGAVPELSPEMQEELVMRVMQRLDVALEQQLPPAISQLVVEHMQLLGPRLWEEVSRVVQQSVAQAMAQELETRTKNT
jgi:hypothetical protein